jgi:hypothetical protein
MNCLPFNQQHNSTSQSTFGQFTVGAVYDLSITHIFGCVEAKHDIGESRKAAPHDDVAWRRI